MICVYVYLFICSLTKYVHSFCCRSVGLNGSTKLLVRPNKPKLANKPAKIRYEWNRSACRSFSNSASKSMQCNSTLPANLGLHCIYTSLPASCACVSLVYWSLGCMMFCLPLVWVHHSFANSVGEPFIRKYNGTELLHSSPSLQCYLLATECLRTRVVSHSVCCEIRGQLKAWTLPLLLLLLHSICEWVQTVRARDLSKPLLFSSLFFLALYSPFILNPISKAIHYQLVFLSIFKAYPSGRTGQLQLLHVQLQLRARMCVCWASPGLCAVSLHSALKLTKWYWLTFPF